MGKNDLISRAAAIAQIKENYCHWCDHIDLCQSCETQDCIATIEQQVPAVNAVPVVQRWISVKDRLPDKPCNYLIHVPPLYTYVVFYNGYDWVVDEDEFCFDAFEITHWMPLPEPPKMDGDT